MKAALTIGFTSHRVETLMFAKQLMKEHDIIILEEAPNSDFNKMLRKKITIQQYTEDQYLEFPEFSKRYYTILRRLYQNGKKIIQIEPYMDRLFRIYEMFSDGKKPMDILADSELRDVFKVEKSATAALLHFYETSMGNSFSKLIESVKIFAKADAERFRLRDVMRADAISDVVSEERVYVEAGGIHIYLEKVLRQKLKSRFKIKTKFLLEPFIKELTGKSKFFPPGDLLTIHYIIQNKKDEAFENLQAARSLIYIKLLEKEEMLPTRENKAPHIEDEININKLISKLTFEQCEDIYVKIRYKNRSESLKMLTSNI